MSIEARIWIVLRNMDGHVGDIEVDVFTNEAAANEQAARIAGPTWDTDEVMAVVVREEMVATEAWADPWDAEDE